MILQIHFLLDNCLIQKACTFFHHVFLPPKIPQEDDYSPQFEGVLLEKVVGALDEFSHYAPSQFSGNISTVITMVDRLKDVRGASGDLCAEKLTEALKELEAQGKHA